MLLSPVALLPADDANVLHRPGILAPADALRTSPTQKQARPRPDPPPPKPRPLPSPSRPANQGRGQHDGARSPRRPGSQQRRRQNPAMPPPSPTRAAAAVVAKEAQPADGKGEGGAGDKQIRADHSELWATPAGAVHVIRGEHNFIVGRTTHAWTHDDERYSMGDGDQKPPVSSGWSNPSRMIQRSEGPRARRGLLPEIHRRARRPDEGGPTSTGRRPKVVLIGRSERHREFSIAEGDQDVLSLMHHLVPADGPLRRALLVVTGKKRGALGDREPGHRKNSTLPAGRVSATIWATPAIQAS